MDGLFFVYAGSKSKQLTSSNLYKYRETFLWMSTMCAEILRFSTVTVRVRPTVTARVRFRVSVRSTVRLTVTLAVSLVLLVSGTSLLALCSAIW